ncbi:MAG: rRNA adenine N(6)-methyltransferase family protein [bacterium]|nr:rRNA adenine N(6)-methyltransferase family protein [bacterium]MDW8087380.1 rRNA adenine dimethyltransferase family protein [Candidatus Calescibacterium sp.]
MKKDLVLKNFLIENKETTVRKSLGQIKLVKKESLEKIASFAERSDNVVEVGSGEGNLTELLSDKSNMVICFEIDRRLKEKILKKISFGILLIRDFLNFPLNKLKEETENFNSEIFVKGDIERIKKVLAETDKFKIVANIPYYISSRFIHKIIIEDFPLLKSIHILVQKEFAHKLCAKPGSYNYSAISAIANLFFETKIEFDVPRFYFRPVPKVHSSFISLKPKQVKPDILNRRNELIDFTYKLFKRRKKVFGNKRVFQLSPEEIADFFFSD